MPEVGPRPRGAEARASYPHVTHESKKHDRKQTKATAGRGRPSFQRREEQLQTQLKIQHPSQD